MSRFALKEHSKTVTEGPERVPPRLPPRHGVGDNDLKRPLWASPARGTRRRPAT